MSDPAPLASDHNPLTNAFSPQVRALLYLALTLLAGAYSTYRATDGDWVQVAGGVFTALLGLLAASNASHTMAP